MPRAIFTLFNVSHISDSAAEDTKFQISIALYVWIGPFLLGEGLNDRGEGQPLR